MKATMCLKGVLGAVIVASLWGCGGGSGGGQGSNGPNVDFGALHQQYAAPSGHLQSSDMPDVMKALSSDQVASAVPVTQSVEHLHLGNVGSGVTIQNLPPQCSGTQGNVSCACPGGGSFSETGGSSGAGGTEASLDFSSCVFTDTSSSTTYEVNGTLSFDDVTSPPPAMLIYSGSFTETVTPPGTTDNVNLNYALINGQVTFNASVSSGGNVLIQESGSWDVSTETGSFTVVDSAGTWNCSATNGHGSCSGPNGTQSF